MSARAKPHVHPVDEAWLELGREEPLGSAIDVVDSHIHLWDFSDPPYFADSYLADASGTGISASVFVDCTMAYRETGPEELQPVGEVEFARQQAEQVTSLIDVGSAIVGWADLTLGDDVRPVLAALDQAGGGRFRGVRVRATYDPDPQAGYGATGIGPGLLMREDFRRGVACLAKAGWVLDDYAFHTQLGEVADLARAFPELPIVLNHLGGPIGIGHYANERAEVFAAWTAGLRDVAGCPNVSIKVGGFAISRIAIVKASGRDRPSTSAEVAELCKPWVEECFAAFGAERCMFGSNFPVDKVAMPMGTLINAMKRLVAHLSAADQERFFSGNARRFYRI